MIPKLTILIILSLQEWLSINMRKIITTKIFTDGYHRHYSSDENLYKYMYISQNKEVKVFTNTFSKLPSGEEIISIKLLAHRKMVIKNHIPECYSDIVVLQARIGYNHKTKSYYWMEVMMDNVDEIK